MKQNLTIATIASITLSAALILIAPLTSFAEQGPSLKAHDPQNIKRINMTVYFQWPTDDYVTSIRLGLSEDGYGYEITCGGFLERTVTLFEHRAFTSPNNKMSERLSHSSKIAQMKVGGEECRRLKALLESADMDKAVLLSVTGPDAFSLHRE